MKQWQIMLKRLGKPSVIMSIVSQGIAILTLLHINVDSSVVMGVVAGISSILVLLGIMSDPNTQTGGYGDDILYCEHCKDDREFVTIGQRMICKECGHPYNPLADNQ